jgi:hypothetical protein
MPIHSVRLIVDHRETQLNELRQRIAADEYAIDPTAVADAMLRRAWSAVRAPLPEPKLTSVLSPPRLRRVVRRRGHGVGGRIRSLVA